MEKFADRIKEVATRLSDAARNRMPETPKFFQACYEKCAGNVDNEEVKVNEA